MNEPTREQIKELWEWCGFERLPFGNRYYHYEQDKRIMNWMPPDETGQWHSVAFLPRIALNSLFRYAVPKIQATNEIAIILPPSDTERAIVRIGHNEPVDMSTLKEALFWAIWRIIKDML